MTQTKAVSPYEFIFRTSADGLITTDAHGLIAQVNPAAAAMINVRVDDVKNRAPEIAFRKYPALVNLFTRSGEHTLEVRLQRRRLAIGIAADITGGGRIVLLQDVTEKRELDSRRDALVSTMSHDLSNPMSALGGFADLVARFGTLNDQQQHFLTRIRQTTSKIQDVIGTLVDLAWIEAGMPLAHVPIDLSKLIRRVVAEMGELAFARQMIIVISVQDPMPTIMGDPQWMRLVLYNLLHNAIIYSASEQTIAIHAWGDPHEVYCSVADRGIGIDDEELESVFERLYRSRSEHVRDIPGGGLGLTITRTIVRRHGGDIWVTSNLGQGSTFTFTLPAVSL